MTASSSYANRLRPCSVRALRLPQSVADLEKRDRAYAQSLAIFRKAVQDIAATPEGQVALRRFNAGDEAGALAILDKLRAAHDQARATESAAEGRRIAALALETGARGKQQTDSMIARYEEVTKLDPSMSWDWGDLSQWYKDGGRLPAAREAARSAARTAKDDRERAVAWNAEADVAVDQGDLAGARARIEEAHRVLRRLAAADPGSASPHRDVAVSLERLGSVLVEQGDLAGARARLLESLDLQKRLTALDPRSASLQRDVSASLSRLGDVLVVHGDLTGARAHFQESLDLDNSSLSYLSVAFSWGVRYELVATNRCKGVERLRVEDCVDFWSREEVKQLLEAARERRATSWSWPVATSSRCRRSSGTGT